MLLVRIVCNNLMILCVSVVMAVTSLSFLILSIWTSCLVLDRSGYGFINSVYLFKEPTLSFIALLYFFIFWSLFQFL